MLSGLVNLALKLHLVAVVVDQIRVVLGVTVLFIVLWNAVVWLDEALAHTDVRSWLFIA